jgi:hypothetical protein
MRSREGSPQQYRVCRRWCPPAPRAASVSEAVEAEDVVLDGQQALHAETLRAYSRYVELRRERLSSVATGLPAVVWWVLLIGAALNIALNYLFSVERLGPHLLLTLALAVFVALLVFLIAAMDHPFRGEFSVGPDAFRARHRQMQAP